MEDPASTHWLITLACIDQPGIVYAISGAIVEAGGNITESQQFASLDTGRFFMRVQVEARTDRETLEAKLAPIASRFKMRLILDVVGRPVRTLVLASTAGHCLSDLLYRKSAGQLQVEIPLILSNHSELRELADFHKVPFELLPVQDDEGMMRFEKRLLDLVSELEIELVVLARFMRIFSSNTCEKLAGRMINIHHSFLPGFKGANPYRQAHSRGVKLIGATAHFVTEDLDEGPIIEQNVVRVSHARSPEELRVIGQNEESRTLSQAVNWFAQHRVLLDGKRTIIFS